MLVGAQWGFVDLDGNMVIEPQFETVNPFARTAMRRRQLAARGFIDRTGQFVVEPQFDSYYFSDYGRQPSEGWPRDVDGFWGYVDAGGAYVIDPQYSMAERFSGGLASRWVRSTPISTARRDCVGPEVSPWAVSARGNRRVT